MHDVHVYNGIEVYMHDVMLSSLNIKFKAGWKKELPERKQHNWFITIPVIIKIMLNNI